MYCCKITPDVIWIGQSEAVGESSVAKTILWKLISVLSDKNPEKLLPVQNSALRKKFAAEFCRTKFQKLLIKLSPQSTADYQLNTRLSGSVVKNYTPDGFPKNRSLFVSSRNRSFSKVSKLLENSTRSGFKNVHLHCDVFPQSVCIIDWSNIQQINLEIY